MGYEWKKHGYGVVLDVYVSMYLCEAVATNFLVRTIKYLYIPFPLMLVISLCIYLFLTHMFSSSVHLSAN